MSIRILIQKTVLLYNWKYHNEALKTYQWFLLTFLGGILNLVIFCQKKNQDSNGSKRISDLTCTKSSSSDDRLPVSYAFIDFLLIWSIFRIYFSFYYQLRRRGEFKSLVISATYYLTYKNTEGGEFLTGFTNFLVL